VLVKLDTSPLQSGHEHRGIGLYTKLLAAELAKDTSITLATDTSTAIPDIIHYPFFDFFFDTLPVRKNAPTVVTIHDVIPLQFPNQYKPGLKGTLRLWKQKLALRTVAAVITDSQASRQAIEKYLYVPADRIHVTYLAGNPEIKPVSAALLDTYTAKYALPSTYLLYVGDINYNKNIPELLKMIAKLPEKYSLVLAGKNFTPQPIPEWHAIEDTVAHYHLADRVTFLADLGDNPSQTLSALYQQAYAYIQPSLAEGFGLPILEALQVGTPVLCSNTTSLPEVGGTVAVYSEPTAEYLASTFMNTIALWQDSDLAQFRTQAATWIKTFSWQKTAQQTRQVYESIV
jgi:alpha-1,3-rhamnosyl/mannosyltransferase